MGIEIALIAIVYTILGIGSYKIFYTRDPAMFDGASCLIAFVSLWPIFLIISAFWNYDD